MATFINLNTDKREHLVFDTKGEYVVFFHNLSGKFIFEMKARDVTVDIYGLFTGKNNEEYKIETIQHHKAPFSTSNLFIKGVFDDASKLHYKGLIRIEKEGQNSHAYQKNQNLMLSPNVFVESNPYLEILANEVFCTHGSTTGRLNEEEIFYAKSRGLSRGQAKQLLVDGFVNDIMEKIKSKVPDSNLQILDIYSH
ncbi:MAG: SufD family Fe-S cluster assembly protein [bacterium]|nr:SufD family Fe-S cluster assembly protein [bacterium]